MIGVRLDPGLEAAFAKEVGRIGRSKSDVVRDLIADFISRRSMDAKIARTAKVLAAHDRDEDYTESDMDD